MVHKSNQGKSLNPLHVYNPSTSWICIPNMLPLAEKGHWFTWNHPENIFKPCFPTHRPLLQERRKRTDLIETFKFNSGLYKTPKTKFFSTPTRSLKGHSINLAKSLVEKDVAKKIFTTRVMSPWNDLSEGDQYKIPYKLQTEIQILAICTRGIIYQVYK